MKLHANDLDSRL